MKAFDLRGFIYEEILEESEKLKSDELKLEYFSYVLREWILNPPRLDPNGEMKPSFEERIKEIIRDLELKLNNGLLTKESKTKQPKKENDEKIWWKGTEPMLIYFFELLYSSNLVDYSQNKNKYALIAKHFKKSDGTDFTNDQLSVALQNMKKNNNAKPKEADSERIEAVIKDIRQFLKS